MGCGISVVTCAGEFLLPQKTGRLWQWLARGDLTMLLHFVVRTAHAPKSRATATSKFVLNGETSTMKVTPLHPWETQWPTQLLDRRLGQPQRRRLLRLPVQLPDRPLLLRRLPHRERSLSTRILVGTRDTETSSAPAKNARASVAQRMGASPTHTFTPETTTDVICARGRPRTVMNHARQALCVPSGVVSMTTGSTQSQSSPTTSTTAPVGTLDTKTMLTPRLPVPRFALPRLVVSRIRIIMTHGTSVVISAGKGHL